jgi:hypothetical protein
MRNLARMNDRMSLRTPLGGQTVRGTMIQYIRSKLIPKCPVCREAVPWQRRWLKPWMWARWPCERCGAILGFDQGWRSITGAPVATLLLTALVLFFFARFTTDPPLVVDVVMRFLLENPVSVKMCVELNRFAWTESLGVGWLSGWCRGLFLTTFQVVRACQVVLNLQVVRARTIIRAGQVALIGQVVRAGVLW